MGFFTNWSVTLGKDTVNMANAGYVVMQNLGYTLGLAFNLGTQKALFFRYLLLQDLSVYQCS